MSLIWSLYWPSKSRMCWGLLVKGYTPLELGVFVCVFMSFFIFSNWFCEELHNSKADKIEALASSIEGIWHYIFLHYIWKNHWKQFSSIKINISSISACVIEYFNNGMTKKTEDWKSSRDTVKKRYRTVLDSKSVEESLVSWQYIYIYILISICCISDSRKMFLSNSLMNYAVY